MNTNKIAIYVHWPYCKSLCPYCDFNSHLAGNIDHSIWLDAYKKEIDYFKEDIKGKKITSIFFGGGTPSLMSANTVGGIINHLSKYADINFAEITLEANPTSSEAKKFVDFKSAGVNRLSIGVQSLIESDLKTLGREHSSSEAKLAIKDAAKVFDNYSFDLIYARPGQKLEIWRRELEEAISLSSKHISLYQLTIEKGTPFFKLHKEGKLEIPSTDEASDFFDLTHEILDKHNFMRYEISNYAKKGFECRHNLTYWYYNDFIGIGPGAHSRVKGEEITMHHIPDKWLKEVSLNGAGIQKRNMLEQEIILNELIMMNLRINSGLDLLKLERISKKGFQEVIDLEMAKKFEKEDLLIINNNKLTLTSKGMNIHSYICSRLIK